MPLRKIEEPEKNMSICPFSAYRFLFGAPKQGLHRFQFTDSTAIVDYVLTIGVSFLTSYWTDIPLTVTTIGWLIIGVIAHVLFGVETATTRFLGIHCDEYPILT